WTCGKRPADRADGRFGPDDRTGPAAGRVPPARGREGLTMPSPSDIFSLPFADWVNVLVRDWLVPNFRPLFRSLQWPITEVLNGLSAFLNATPMLVFTVALALAAWRVAGRGVAIFTLLALSFIDVIGLWSETMTTLAMV